MHTVNAREAIVSLYAAKQRSLLALIGIVIGIGSVIAMLSVGVIAKQQALEHFRELGTEFLNIRVQTGAPGTGRNAQIRLADAVGLPDETRSIAAVAPWNQSHGEVVYAGKKVADASAMGVTGSFIDVNKLHIAQGRAISDLDFRRPHCVLGAAIASALRRAGAAQPIGESVLLADRIFTVVGVMRPAKGGGMLPFEPDKAILIPFSTAQRLFPDRGVRQITARMSPDVHHAEATRDVQRYFRRTSPGVRTNVVSAQRVIEQMQRQMQTFALLLAAVGSISLIVGGVGVMNVMLVSVTERRVEIGIRRALGARRFDIQMQFLTESIVLSLIGGVFGILLGVAGTWVFCWVTKWTFLVDLQAAVLGFGVACCVGLFFGLQPAHQAARLDPIAALRAG